MNVGHSWRAIDPTQFNEGVLYLPDMVEIQPSKPDWDLPNMRDVFERIIEDRPHGGDETKGKLLCLRCMAINARAGKALAPVWMYFKQRNKLRLFCHMGSHEVHSEHMPESDEHKALVQREVQICERVGASVETEVRTAKGRRRADFIAVGPEVTLAGEVQLTRTQRQSIGQRQRDLTRDGSRALWTTDNTRPDFLEGVPRLVIPALSGWQQALRDPELAIVAGWWLVEYQRCGWADEWNGGGTRCPRTQSLRPCGRIHAYPTRDATTRTYRPTRGRAMQSDTGNRPHLDLVVGGIVVGEWLPYKRKVKTSHQFEWIPAEDYQRVIEDRGGGDPKEAERSPGANRLATVSADRTCEPRSDGRGSVTIVGMKPPLPNRQGPNSVLDADDAGASHLRKHTVDTPDLDGWANHPRWAYAQRCTICRQPMFTRESIRLGVCLRHRVSMPADSCSTPGEAP